MSVLSLFRSVSSYYPASLRPPPQSGDLEEDERAWWDNGEALIDSVAYMIDESNHTSARCPFTTREGSPEQLQVTFFLAPPPHVSYFSIAYTSGEPTRFVYEPRILATAGNLALICARHGPISLGRPTNYNFFVYHAPTHVQESPRLGLLPHPEPDLFPWGRYCYFTQGKVGILRYRTRSHRPPFIITYTTPRNDECDAYKIATIYTRTEESGITDYDLFIYDSKTEAWTRDATVFPREPPRHFSSDRVVTIARTMVWVDLSQGVILCDLLHAPPEEEEGRPRQLRYIPLPKSVRPLGPRETRPVLLQGCRRR
nr:uncharacterized protein LOC127309600 [Lolium perenne]